MYASYGALGKVLLNNVNNNAVNNIDTLQNWLDEFPLDFVGHTVHFTEGVVITFFVNHGELIGWEATFPQGTRNARNDFFNQAAQIFGFNFRF